MTELRDTERRISAWLEDEEAGTRYPDHLLRAAFEETRGLRQVRSLRSRAFLMQHALTFLAGAGVAAVVVVAVAALGLGLRGAPTDIGASPSPVTPTPGLTQSPAPSASPEVAAFLDAFIRARIAGVGAGQYLNDPGEVPLLYETTEGLRYERGEFEQVRGVEWPYGYTGFQIRLFARETVVEQLFFWPNGAVAGLVYDPDGYGTHIAPTTENGQPVASPFQYFDGALTLRVAHPWVMSPAAFIPLGRLIPEGPGVPPTTDGGERIAWDRIFIMADPTWVGTGCQTMDPGDAEAHAAALTERIQSDPGLEATTPVALTAGGYEGLMLDVKLAAGASVCWNVTEGGSNPDDDPGVLYPVWDMDSETVVRDGQAMGRASGDWMRLYLFDVPATSGMQWLVIAVVAPESTFTRAVEAAQPIVDSIEITTP